MQQAFKNKRSVALAVAAFAQEIEKEASKNIRAIISAGDGAGGNHGCWKN